MLGLTGYVSSGNEHPTALIPAFFGLLLAIFGFLARDEKRRMMAMHIAVTVGLLGFLGGLFSLLSGNTAQQMPMAVASKSIMTILMAIYVALCVRSFIAARRRRAGA